MDKRYDTPGLIHSEKRTESVYCALDRRRTGRKLQLYMELSGIGPRDIQRYLSLSCVQTVYRWLSGTNVPTIDNLYAMSRLFHVRMDDLIDGGEGCRPEYFYDREKVRQVNLRIEEEPLSQMGAA
ncbi:MAG: helix-turn-helix domain-containing protein [Clostridiales bacterium]|nr:helix-turn-helix domain-containing protein [Clostridiales bacterium]